MTNLTEPECHACRRTIADQAVRKQNTVTLEWVEFHALCWYSIVARRRNDLDRIACRFKRGALGPDGFDAQLPSWPHARFDNPAFRNLASPIILEALERWGPDGGSMVLSARTGAGKTASCVAKLHRLRAEAESALDLKLLPEFLFVTAAQLSGARRHLKLGTGESYLVEQACCRDLLILDEIGFEPLDSVSFEILDARYRRQLPTLVTTGLFPKHFAERYGSAAWRRLTESGTVVEDHSTRKLAVAR